MTDAEALEIAVARTGHQRFRELLDPAHPAYDPRYWEVVRGLAGEPPPAPQPPGFFRTAVSFVKAVAAHVAAGLPEVSRAEADARLAVCGGCPCFTPQRTCQVCRCGMDLKVKWATSHCPLKKWPGD